MPLTEVGRGYADRLLQKKLEEIQKELGEELGRIRQEFARRNLVKSGVHISAQAAALADGIRQRTQARAETTLTAYEKSGIPFDDVALQEITDEVTKFAHEQQHIVIGTIGETIQHTFIGSTPQTEVHRAVTQQIQRAVSAIKASVRRDLEIKRDEIMLDEAKGRRTYGAALGKRWDVFICHASEDKATFVRELATSLAETGLDVWYDEFSLKVGDSLREAIDHGLANSQYGVVVLSKHFFEKNWPQRELDGLFSKEIAGIKVVLPVWHDVTFDEVSASSPMLAGLMAAKSNEGMQVVIRKLRDAMGL